MARFTNNHRWRNQIFLLILSIAFVLLIVSLSSESRLNVVSITSAYLCLSYLAVALLIGPIQSILFNVRPINSYLRRDIGIWAAITGLVHLVIATKLTMTSTYVDRYVEISSDGLSASIRMQLFMWGSVAAYIIGIIFLLLLLLSNDKIVKKLGAKWWKRLERSAYLAFLLTVIHGLIFQFIEARNLALMSLLMVIFLLILLTQTAGIFSVRRRKQAEVKGDA